MNRMFKQTSKMKFNINDYVKQNIINLSINNKQVIDNFNQVDSFDKRTINRPVRPEDDKVCLHIMRPTEWSQDGTAEK